MCDNYKAQQWLSLILNEFRVIFHKGVYHRTLEYFSNNQNAMLANLNVCDNYKAQQWLSFIQNESMVIFHKEVYHHTLEYFSSNQMQCWQT